MYLKNQVIWKELFNRIKAAAAPGMAADDSF